MKKFLLLIILFSLACTGASAQTDSLERHKVGRIISSAAGSLAINGALTEILKDNIHKTRPDGSDRHSFPSRHSSWAFTASTIFSNELYGYSPFFSLGGQMAATIVGMQRVVSKNHYPSDVLAGAALGVASTELSYFICRKIFHAQNPFSGNFENDFKINVSMSTGGMFYLSNGQSCGLAARVDAAFPTSDHFGVYAGTNWIYTPSKADGGYQVVSSNNILAGVCTHFTLPHPSWAVEGNLKAGTIYNNSSTGIFGEGFKFQAAAEAGISYRLTAKFAWRASVEYSYIVMRGGQSAVGAYLSSVALF
ncbi:MAG: phosphatase PAP2 family protein [Bacteroidales bacterium]|nr:phosphatase PAP2 family protein [Bacteroidales bacterium]